MKTPLLENPKVLRIWGIAYVFINAGLSAYYYNHFPSLLTWLPALFAIGICIYAWREAQRFDNIKS